MKARFISDVGEPLITLELEPKIFSTGSRGFRSQGKMTVDGRKYQLQVQVVQIGTKTKTN